GADWSWTWDFSGQPRTTGEYTFTIWAADSNFCLSVVDECDAVTMTLTIDNSNSAPFISLLSPQDGQRLSIADTTIEGVSRDNDGSVSRVDITVRDIYNGDIIVHQQSVTEFETNGAWSTTWDPTILQHDFEYAIDVRSYDGYDFSEMSTITIIADNPSDAGNNQPVFDSDGWSQEIVLFCEISSQSQDRCTKGEIDLNQFFSDLDIGQDLILSVYDNPSEDFTSDDYFALVINVGQDGIAIYDPISMFFYDNNMSSWTLDNVIFMATDSHGSKEISLPVTFTVVGINFQINDPDVTVIDDGEIIIFSGVGLPGKTVTVLINHVNTNDTVVNADSTWTLGIPSSRFSDGPVTPVFRYVGADYSSGVQISVGVPDEGLSLAKMVIISIVVIGLLGGVFVYFFVEVEDEESFDESGEEEPSEGWIWDESSNEWIEDPDYDS
ncbi:MAG: Ig-like domain-containing protein, partial [Candidatus Poseidoniales archaeon]|nr:Ig-like domain-containing protein [Candidatus Poseidoniales archaeon]